MKLFVTLTLTPEMLALPVKTQLMKSFPLAQDFLKAFALQPSDQLVIEFTKQNNVHYHILICNWCEIDTFLPDNWIRERQYKHKRSDLKNTIIGHTKLLMIPQNKDNGIDAYMVKDVTKTETKLRRIGCNSKYKALTFASQEKELTFKSIKMKKTVEFNPLLDFDLD